MKTFGSFGELRIVNAEADKAFLQRQKNVVSAEAGFVNNFYGQGVHINDPSKKVCAVGISVESNHFPNKARESSTWEAMKSSSNPTIMTVDILGFAPDCSRLEPIRGDINLGTGELRIGAHSEIIGSPADAIMTALKEDGANARLSDAVEKVVWDFVVDNLNEFDWRTINEQSR